MTINYITPGVANASFSTAYGIEPDASHACGTIFYNSNNIDAYVWDAANGYSFLEHIAGWDSGGNYQWGATTNIVQATEQLIAGFGINFPVSGLNILPVLWVDGVPQALPLPSDLPYGADVSRISAQGTFIVGSSSSSANSSLSVIWQSMNWIDGPSATLSPGFALNSTQYSILVSIDESGNAVGFADFNTGNSYPASWTETGGWVNLELMGDAVGGSAVGISSITSIILGSFTMLDGSQHGGLYQSGIWTDIGIPEGMQSIYPVEISSDGTQIALVVVDSLGNAYTYSYDITNSIFTEVVSDPTLNSAPYSIANNGTMAGSANNPADTDESESAIFASISIPPPVAYPSNASIAYNSSDNAVSLSITGEFTSVAVSTQATNGTVTASGVFISYTPNNGFYGTDAFSYTATGPGGTSSPATVIITVVAYFVNSVLKEPKLIGTVHQVNYAATLYPSYLVPINIRPPYVAVDILETEALASAPFIDESGNHDQLMKDKVRITLYGFGNNTALDFLDFVLGYSLEYGNIGILNLPRLKDEKRAQAELQIIAAKKTIEFEVSYYQSRSQEVARQLILHCFPNFVFT